jgi:hypothetical protein
MLSGMAIARILALAFLVLLHAAAPAADANGRRTDDLLHASGLWKQLGEIDPAIRMMLAESQEKARTDPAASRLGPEELKRLSAAMAASFEADSMRRIVSENLARRLSAEDERAALRWLDSNLGRRITRMEERAEEATAAPVRAKLGKELLEKAAPARRKQYERLAAAVNAGNAGADLMINMTSAMLYGVASTVGGVDAGTLRKVRAQIAARRPELVRGMREQALVGFAFAYRGLPDGDLDTYVEFVESPAGRRYSDACMKSLDEAFTRAALDMGERIGAQLPAERRRSS